MQIVRIGKQFYVVGVGDNVEILHEITDENVTTELMQGKETTPVNQMTQIFSRFKKQPDDQQSETFKSHYARELEQMKQNRQKLVDTYKEDRHE
nr:flagellar biosynthetic protein FliO [Lentibacillus sp. JNUCC-1]